MVLITLAQITRAGAHDVPHILLIILIGIIVGFLSGLLGKGGSAITTPALQIFAGIPPFLALASPLPASLSNSLSGSVAYKREHLVQKKVVILSVVAGIPATLLGAFLSPLVGGRILMMLTALFVSGLGLSFVLPAVFHRPFPELTEEPSPSALAIVILALVVGVLSGLLANGGGVLFAPLFIRLLKLPAKQAMASSLLVAGALALPGTVAHWWLGHIDWWIVLWLTIGSVPSAYAGARVAIRMKNATLELIFGIMLCLFGFYDLFFTLRRPR